MKERDANRKYRLELFSALIAYMVVLVGSIYWAKIMDEGAVRTLLLMTPVVPLMLAVWAIARHFGRMDEFVRLRSLEGLAIAAAVTGRPDLHLWLSRVRRLSQGQYVLGLGRDGYHLGPVHLAALLLCAMKNLVRELRTEHGWSQGDLADKLEVSRQTVNAIETGRYDPSLPLAFTIAKLFGKPIEKIFSTEK
jgi:putative transcriptional regulator